MQIKTTLRFQLIPDRMTKIKNPGDSRCWQECRKKGTLLHCWWDCKLVQPLWKSVWQFLRKLNIVLPEVPAIPLFRIYPEDAPTCNKDTCSTMFIETLFVIARSWKEPRYLSKEEWLQKMWYIYIMEYYSEIKNNEFMKFLGKWMDLEDIILSVVTHITKEPTRYVLTDKWVLAQKLGIPKYNSQNTWNSRRKIKVWILRSFLEWETKYPWKELQRQSSELRQKGRKDYPETAPPGDPSHMHPSNPDTIAYARKILLTGPWDSSLLWGYACAWQIQTWMHTWLFKGC